MEGQGELGVEDDPQDARLLSWGKEGRVDSEIGLAVGLVGVVSRGGEELDCGFQGGEGEFLLLRPQ